MPEPDLLYLRQQAEKLRNACTDLIGHYDQAVTNPAHLGVVAWAPVRDWSCVPERQTILAWYKRGERAVVVTYHDGYVWQNPSDGGISLDTFTHWALIPEPTA